MKQWWIKQGSYTGESHVQEPFYSTVVDYEPDASEFTHVIEYSEYLKLEKKLTIAVEALKKISRLGFSAGVPSSYEGREDEYWAMAQRHAGAQAPQKAQEALDEIKDIP